MTKPLQILLAMLLLTAAPVRATRWADGPCVGWRSDALSPTARAQLDVMAADSDGALRLIEADGQVTITASGASRLPTALADWARRHGLAVPPVAPDGRETFVAAETVLSATVDRDVVPDGATALLATTSADEGRAQWPTCPPDRPTTPSEPMADAAVAPRAPPRA